MNKKPRHDTITWEFAGPTATKEVKVYADGRVELLAVDSTKEPINITREKFYERENGKNKTIIKMPISAGDLSLTTVLKQYDVLFAIDANTEIHDNNRISGYSIIQFQYLPDEDKIIVHRANSFTSENLDPGTEEKVAWVHSISNITGSKHYSKTSNYALITDHDLDNHSQYNSREKPLLGDFLLPENFDLLYASSDVKNDTIFNQLLRKCDDNASSTIKEYLKTRD